MATAASLAAAASLPAPTCTASPSPSATASVSAPAAHFPHASSPLHVFSPVSASSFHAHVMRLSSQSSYDLELDVLQQLSTQPQQQARLHQPSLADSGKNRYGDVLPCQS